MPMAMAQPGETKPAPGVMVARPATAPEAAPRVVGLPRCHHSMTHQVAMPAMPPRWVAAKAPTATPSAARALPALKPNQPNHKRPVPSSVMGRLCGTI